MITNMIFFGLSLAVLLLAADAQQISDMKNRLKFQVNNIHFPPIRTMLQNMPQPFIDDAKTYALYEIDAARNVIIYYSFNPPFPEWLTMLSTNALGLATAQSYLQMMIPNDQLEKRMIAGFEDVTADIENLYTQVASDIDTKKCQAKIRSQLSLFTNDVSKNISHAVDFLTKGFNSDVNSERATFKDLYSSFHTSIYYCTLKLLPDCKNCIIDLINGKGQTVATYSKNFQQYLYDLYDRYFRNVKEQMSFVAFNMENEFPKIYKVPCLEH